MSNTGYDDSKSPDRQFETGATRDQDSAKLDYEGFLSPIALTVYAEYMHKNRQRSDGTIRDSDNWQRGIPPESYIKSLWRHFMDVWHHHRRTGKAKESLQEALCGVIFNSMGLLHEVSK